MAEIVLTTLNAKYRHAAFGLRCLRANLGDLRPQTALLEFDLEPRPRDVAEIVLRAQPRIVGLGVHIWNVALATELAAVLKRLRPDVILILGGPEISHETATQPIFAHADYVITGEADLKFAEVCRQLLAGNRPADKIIPAEPPQFSQLASPYDDYSDHDLAQRVVYVEASRGCPFGCEFCLSALDPAVRQAPLPDFLRHLGRLLERGARQIKFADRTFNLNPDTSRRVLEFLLAHCQPDRSFHFEIVPDRLPESLRDLLRQFPAGALQFEVGIQTFNPEVAARIQRRQDYPKLIENLRFLRAQTGVHVHADLLVGLPGESLESFAAGFDQLVGLQPQEIQVGLLKRLRGAPITRHDAEWQMRYNPHPPYELLQNSLLDFADVQRLSRFARHWDLVCNSGNFAEAAPLLWRTPAATPAAPTSPFAAFLRWSQWLHAQVGRMDRIALVRLMELLFRYLTQEAGLDPVRVAQILWRDYQHGGRSDKPPFLRPYLPAQADVVPRATLPSGLPRQARHRLSPGAA